MNYLCKLADEQLSNQGEPLSAFLSKFEEGVITFPPTYKIGNAAGIQGSVVGSITMIVFRGGLTVFSTAGVAS